MTTPINLNHVRKAKKRVAAERKANENRIRHGRSKSEANLSDLKREAAKIRLDDHKLER